MAQSISVWQCNRTSKNDDFEYGRKIQGARAAVGISNANMSYERYIHPHKPMSPTYHKGPWIVHSEFLLSDCSTCGCDDGHI